MRRLMISMAVVAVFVSLSMPFAAAGRDDKAAEKAVTNKMCPLMGEASNPKWRAEYEGQYVYFCCSGCVDMFKADPKAAIAKMSDEDKAAIQKNTKCPISGEEIGSWDIRVEEKGKLVYFCCPACKGKYLEAHPDAKAV